MSKEPATLNAVAVASKKREDAKAQLLIEAQAWYQKQLQKFDAELEQAVIEAADDDHSVSNIARAYTQSGKTPNRNAIYTILAKRQQVTDAWVSDYPFEWVPREVKTAAGKRTVYDVHVELEDFGPEDVSGEFTWRYDTATHELDEVLGVEDPYPASIKYYDQVLSRWLQINPYPGEE